MVLRFWRRKAPVLLRRADAPGSFAFGSTALQVAREPGSAPAASKLLCTGQVHKHKVSRLSKMLG